MNKVREKHRLQVKRAFEQNTGLRELYLSILCRMSHTTASNERKEQIASSVVRNFVIKNEIQSGLPHSKATQSADIKVTQILNEIRSIRREERALERSAIAKKNATDAKTDAIKDLFLESSMLYNQAAQLYRHIMYASGNAGMNTTSLAERASRTMREAHISYIFAEEASADTSAEINF